MARERPSALLNDETHLRAAQINVSEGENSDAKPEVLIYLYFALMAVASLAGHGSPVELLVDAIERVPTVPFYRIRSISLKRNIRARRNWHQGQRAIPG